MVPKVALRLHNLWVRRAALALLCLVGVWAVAWLLVPPILKSQLESRASAVLDRRVTVGAVDFKPWSLELTISDLAVATADGKGVQFKAARLYVDAELQSLLRGAPVVDAVSLDSPVLTLTHLGQGHYDVDDIIARVAAPDAPPSGPLPRFSLHNLVLQDGALDFSDHTARGLRQHTLRKVNLAIPFLSNFDSQRDVVVQPRLAFELNGSAFDTALQGTPFAQTRKGELTLRAAGLDIAPYVPYLPANLPVQLKSAVLDSDVQVAFVESPAMSVAVRGSLKVSNLRLADGAGRPLAGIERLSVQMQDVRPLEHTVQLTSVEVASPTVQIRRDRKGQWNVLGAPSAPSASGATGAASKDKRLAPADLAPAALPPTAWQFSLAQFTLHQGKVQWVDELTQPQVQMTASDIELQAKTLQWPLAQTPATLEASAALVQRGSPARVVVTGRGSDAAGQVHAQLDGWDLAGANPYLAQRVVPVVGGVASADLNAQWKAAALTLDLNRFLIKDFTLVDPAEAKTGDSRKPSRELPTQFKTLEVLGAHVDLQGRSVKVDRVRLQSPRLGVARDDKGLWMFERWFTPVASTTAAQAASAQPSAVQAASVQAASAQSMAPASSVAGAVPQAPPSAAPWSVTLTDALVQDGSVSLRDRFTAHRVNVLVTDLNVQARAVNLDGTQPAQVSVSAHVKSGQTEPGTLQYTGNLGWSPVQMQGTLQAQDLPSHTFAPYFADRLNMDVLRADASAKGSIRLRMTPQGPQLQLHMDAALEDLRVNSLPLTGSQGQAVGEELLNWKSLNVPGIDVAMSPGTATRIALREATLTDFYARVIVNPQGRLNLQDLVKPSPDSAASAASASVASASASERTPEHTGATVPPLDPIITVGPISVVNGRVPFSDRFIQPNYSADLSELTGKLGGFSSQAQGDSVQLADLDLKGRAEGSATLEITGRLNPLAHPLALNIQGKVRELELPPLSPYAIKYAGYGIERGKLDVEVRYEVQPNGQLTASNKIVLHQLSFGDKVEGAPNSLPVKLAALLLADRNGVIDLDLPISGSLNDPQFSIGPVVWKVFTNLIAKALTSPFSLLANAFGGSDALSVVPFPAGSAVLSPESRKGLDQVASALRDKPALTMTVVGAAGPQAEREGLKRERLNAWVLAEKRRRTAVSGQDTSDVSSVTAQEYPVLLKEVYKRADMVKPRNMVGLTKDLPVAEMEALLLANITVNDDAMRELALNRGVAVRDYLAAQNIAGQRLYLGATKLMAEVDWKPQAELHLSTR